MSTSEVGEARISREWLRQVLKLSEDLPIEIEEDSEHGFGFLSNMVRVKIGSEDNERRLVVKLLPQDDKMRELTIKAKFHDIENAFYERFLPLLIKNVPSIEQFFPKILYAKIQEENSLGPALIMEDLKVLGYVTTPFSSHLSSKELQIVITFMGEFHIGSLLVEENEGPLLKKFPFLQEWLGPFEELSYNWFESAFSLLDTYFNEQGLEDIVVQLASASSHSRKIFETVMVSGKEFGCAIHGDIWSNNLMFNAKARSVKVIDWQCFGYIDPSYDLAVFLLTSLSIHQISEEGIKGYVKNYYQNSTQIRQKTGFKVKERSWEEFYEFFNSYALAYAFIWFTLSADSIMSRSENLEKFNHVYRYMIQEKNICQFLLKMTQNK